jgi:hypothetical protein
VSAFFGGCGKFPVGFLLRFFYKTNEGGNKTEGGGGKLFVMSPDGFFWKEILSRFFTPLVTKPQKKRLKRRLKNNKSIKK